jgi:hypothetical protein
MRNALRDTAHSQTVTPPTHNSYNYKTPVPQWRIYECIPLGGFRSNDRRVLASLL